MNRSAKILLIAAGVVIASYPGAAWVTGIIVQRKTENDQRALLEQAPYLHLVKQQYDRGVYTSTDVVTYRIEWPSMSAVHAPCSGASPCTVTFRTVIQHGPLPGLRTVALATMDTTLVLPPGERRALARTLDDKPILRIHTRMGWLGGVTASAEVPAFTDGPQFSSRGITATLTGHGTDSWSFKLSSPGFSAGDSAGGRANLTGLTLSGHGHEVLRALNVGAFKLTADRVQVTVPHPGSAFLMHHFSMSDASSLSDGFLDLRVRLSADALRVGTPATPVALTHVVYAVGVYHIDAAEFAAFTKAIRAAETNAAGDPAQYRASLIAAVRRYGPQLLLHQPVIHIRQVGFSLPQGGVRLSGTISMPGLSAADLQGPAMLAALKSHAQVTADVRVDQSLLKSWSGRSPKAAARAQALERMGYLSAAGTAVMSHIVYTAGKLTLNGHPYPPVRPN